MSTDCRVYWGSHGCDLPRGHDGPHLCDCTFAEDGSLLPHMDDDPDGGNVGRAPYYGSDTHFYGEDAPLIHRLRSVARNWRLWGWRITLNVVLGRE